MGFTDDVAIQELVEGVFAIKEFVGLLPGWLLNIEGRPRKSCNNW